MQRAKNLSLGSPPPTRGTPTISSLLSVVTGITPAYAGNTITRSFLSVQSEDHPRLRGEHLQAVYNLPLRLGSPPPTRGTLKLMYTRLTRCRITPAYAGNTTLHLGKSQPLEDHPRLRGEHRAAWVMYSTISGSPPPTRGTRYY